MDLMPRVGAKHNMSIDVPRFPADLVPLASSSQAGGCYVDTANLDGESNLKLKEKNAV